MGSSIPIGGFKLEIGGDIKGLQKAVAEGKVSIEDLGKFLESKIDKSSTAAERSVNRLVKELTGVRPSNQLNQLAVALEKVGGTSKLTEVQIANLGKRIEALKAQGGAVPASLQGLTKSVEGLGAATDKLKTAAIQDATGQLGMLGTVMQALGPAGLAAAVGIGGLVIAGAGAIGVGKAMGDLVVNAANWADKITDTATATGMTTEAVQRLEHAAIASGVPLEKVTGAVIKMQRAMEESPQKFDRLGLSMAELKALAPEQQLEKVAERLQMIQDPAERNTLAVQLLGKSWAELAPLIAGGLGAMQDANVMSAEQVAELDELRNQLNVVGVEWDKLWVQIGGAIATGTHAGDAIKLIGDMVRDLADSLKSFPDLPAGLKMLAAMDPTGITGALQYGAEGIQDYKEAKARQDNEAKRAVIQYLGHGDLNAGFKRLRDNQIREQEEEAARKIKAEADERAAAEEKLRRAVERATREREAAEKKAFEQRERAYNMGPINPNNPYASSVELQGQFFAGEINAAAMARHQAQQSALLEDGPAGDKARLELGIRAIGALETKADKAAEALGVLSDRARLAANAGYSRTGSMISGRARILGETYDEEGNVIDMDPSRQLIGGPSIGGAAMAGVWDAFDAIGSKLPEAARFASQALQMFGIKADSTAGILSSVGTSLASGDFLGAAAGMFDIGSRGGTVGDIASVFSLPALAGNLFGGKTGKGSNTGFENTDVLLDRLNDGMQRNSMSADEMATSFDAAFNELIPNAINTTTGLLTDNAQALIEVARSSGIASEAIKTLMAEQTKAAAGNLAGGLAGLTAAREKGQGGLVSQGAATGIGAAIGQNFLDLQKTMSQREALEALAPAIRSFREELTAAGLEGGAAFDAIEHKLTIISGAITGPLVESTSGFVGVLANLNNTGGLTAEIFAGITAQVGANIEALAREGVEGPAALSVLQPQLQTIWELQQKHGFAVDASTQGLIDLGLKGGTIGPEMQSAGDKMAGSMDRVADAVEALVRGLVGVGKQLTELDGRQVGIRVNTTYTNSGNPPPGGGGSDESENPEGFAGGSGGIRNFGAGTLAILHGLEGVFTADQLDSMLSSSYAMGARTAPASAGGMDGALLDEIRGLRRDLAANSARVGDAIRDSVQLMQR